MQFSLRFHPIKSQSMHTDNAMFEEKVGVKGCLVLAFREQVFYSRSNLPNVIVVTLSFEILPVAYVWGN